MGLAQEAGLMCSCFVQGIMWAMVLRVAFASSVASPGTGQMHALIRDRSAFAKSLCGEIRQDLQPVC